MISVTKKIDYTPRKLRLVANMVKGMGVDDAFMYLMNVNKKGALIVYKAIKSAVNNAQSKGVNPSELFISDIRVDMSLTLKRYNYQSRGRIFLRKKRYSTLTVRLSA